MLNAFYYLVNSTTAPAATLHSLSVTSIRDLFMGLDWDWEWVWNRDKDSDETGGRLTVIGLGSALAGPVWCSVDW